MGMFGWRVSFESSVTKMKHNNKVVETQLFWALPIAMGNFQ